VSSGLLTKEEEEGKPEAWASLVSFLLAFLPYCILFLIL